MKRRVLVLSVAALVVVPAALGWPGRPTAPAPPPPNPGAPPAAWIETKAKSAWLAFGSYCWKTACVDMIPPQSRPGLPTFAARRGGVVRVHLGFRATSAGVSIGKKTVKAKLDATKRIVSWTAGPAGILTVAARAGGDASYVARITVR